MHTSYTNSKLEFRFGRLVRMMAQAATAQSIRTAQDNTLSGCQGQIFAKRRELENALHVAGLALILAMM